MKYEIKGEPMPVAICSLEAGETINCESGAMSWMTPNMEMKTSSGGGVGKLFGKMISGEHLFQNTYTCKGGNGMIAFASSFPGSIRALEIGPDKNIVIQKSAYLASQPGVDLSVFFQKKAMGGFFGGEGFIMQKLSGHGVAFVELDGSVEMYELGAGESLLIDTGHVAMMDATCTLDVKAVKGVKNVLLGGEGFFNTIVTGPGRVWLQTMPMVNFASAIASVIPSNK